MAWPMLSMPCGGMVSRGSPSRQTSRRQTLMRETDAVGCWHASGQQAARPAPRLTGDAAAAGQQRRTRQLRRADVDCHEPSPAKVRRSGREQAVREVGRRVLCPHVEGLLKRCCVINDHVPAPGQRRKCLRHRGLVELVRAALSARNGGQCAPRWTAPERASRPHPGGANACRPKAGHPACSGPQFGPVGGRQAAPQASGQPIVAFFCAPWSATICNASPVSLV